MSDEPNQEKAALPAPLTMSLGEIPPYQPAFAQTGEQLQHYSGSVYSCVRLVGTRLGGLELKAAKKLARRKPARKRVFGIGQEWMKQFLPRVKGGFDEASWELLDDHPALDALADPNPFHTGEALITLMSISLDLTGWSFVWISRLPKPDEDGREVILLPLPASWVRPHHEPTPFAGWAVQPKHAAGEPIIVPREEMMVCMLPDPADPFGAASPLQAMAKAVHADEAIQESQAFTFDNSAHPGLIFTAARNPDLVGGGKGSRPVLDASQRAQILNWARQYNGARRSGQPLVVDGVFESIDYLLPPGGREMDYLRSNQASIERLLMAWNVPAASLGQLRDANRASSAIAETHLNTNVVNPRARLISSSLTAWLSYLWPDNPAMIFLVPARASDPEMDLQRHEQLARHHAITVNELRAANGLGPVEWGEGPAGFVEGDADAVARANEFDIRHGPDQVLRSLLRSNKLGSTRVEDVQMKTLAMGRLAAAARDLDSPETAECLDRSVRAMRYLQILLEDTNAAGN